MKSGADVREVEGLFGGPPSVPGLGCFETQVTLQRLDDPQLLDGGYHERATTRLSYSHCSSSILPF